MTEYIEDKSIQIFSIKFLKILILSTLINFFVFLIVPHFTYLKPVTPRKLYTVDLYRLPKERSKEEKIVRREKLPSPPIDKNVENINLQAQEAPLSEEEQTIYELTDLDTIPRILFMVKPTYPEELRLLGKEGRVVLKFMINYFGYVEDVIVLEHSIDPLFDQAAIDAVRKWRFTPPTVKGRPAAVWFIIPIRFQLED